MGLAPALSAAHRRRLRQMWRSAGWPCQDVVEAELVVMGLLERVRDDVGRETLRVSDAGVQVIVATAQRNRAARDAHEALVARIAQQMQRAGRIAWRGLRLRAPLEVAQTPSPRGHASAGPSHMGEVLGEVLGESRAHPREASTLIWPVVMPDVFSIRHTTVEDYVEPMVHEVKVRRADLLSDLRHEAKREAYRALSSQCWYVLQAGIGEVDEIPLQYGVMVAQAERLEVLRAAPRRAMKLHLATWMALSRANAEPALNGDEQDGLQTID